MKTIGHLALEEQNLPAGQEWTSPEGIWSFVLILRGAAYWLSTEVKRSLTEGEMLIIGPACVGNIRASQLNDVSIQSLKFSPALLCGFLTLAERHFFETDAEQNPGEVRFLPSTHPLTERFKSVAKSSARVGSLAQRAEALSMVAAVFENQLSRHQPIARPSSSASH